MNKPKRISKGVFVAVTKENSCLLIQGNGRDLSILEDNSIDAIITDHPYQLEKSHQGGNRHLVDYDTFQYTKEDFIEKYRVLKPGGFLVEMLPERNNDNIEYLNSILTILKTTLATLFIRFFHDVNATIIIILIIFLMTIVGQIGDLFFSAIKRKHNIKDFSNLIPGHGGVLDRLDSLIFVATIFMIFIERL